VLKCLKRSKSSSEDRHQVRHYESAGEPREYSLVGILDLANYPVPGSPRGGRVHEPRDISGWTPLSTSKSYQEGSQEANINNKPHSLTIREPTLCTYVFYFLSHSCVPRGDPAHWPGQLQREGRMGRRTRSQVYRGSDLDGLLSL